MTPDKIEKIRPIPTREEILAQSKDERHGLQADMEKPPGLEEVERQKIKTIPYQQLEEQARSFVYLTGGHIVILDPKIEQRNENLLRTVQALLPGKIECIRVEIPTQNAYQPLKQRFRKQVAIQFLIKRQGTTESIEMGTTHKDIWEKIVRDFEVDPGTAERGRRLLAHFALSVFQGSHNPLMSRVKYDPNSDTFLSYYVTSLQKSFAMRNLGEDGSLHLSGDQGQLLIIPAYETKSVESVDQMIQKKLQER